MPADTPTAQAATGPGSGPHLKSLLLPSSHFLRRKGARSGLGYDCRQRHGRRPRTPAREPLSVIPCHGPPSEDDPCQAVSHQGFLELFVAAQAAPLHPDRTRTPLKVRSQEASVPTLNSRMFWQFGESRAPEPPPPSLSWGSTAIHRSGQTGIGSWVAAREPLAMFQ